MIDDSTRLLARFVPHDSTEENMKLPETYLQRFGPIASVLHRQGEPVPESREDQAGRIAAGTRRQGNAFDAERPGRRGLKAAASSLAARNQKMCKQPLADSFGKAVPQSRRYKQLRCCVREIRHPFLRTKLCSRYKNIPLVVMSPAIRAIGLISSLTCWASVRSSHGHSMASDGGAY